jgi:fimbrial isopeptide formation D2 family protein
VLSWTIPLIAANGGSEVLTFEVELDADFPVGVTTLPNVVVVVGPGSNCPDESEDADCDTTTTVNQPALTILKDVSGNTGGTAINGTPIAKVGDTLTYTLTYDISSPPAHDGVITDVVPVGLDYVAASATSNAEFTFTSYNAATRTLTWNAASVTVDGSLSFKVTVLASAPNQTQPIVNVATIDSDETAPDDDDAVVLVQQVQAATGTPLVTPPTTDTIGSTTQAPSSNAGFSLMLVLLALAAFVLSLGYVTPAPERARRRTEGRRR